MKLRNLSGPISLQYLCQIILKESDPLGFVEDYGNHESMNVFLFIFTNFTEFPIISVIDYDELYGRMFSSFQNEWNHTDVNYCTFFIKK